MRTRATAERRKPSVPDIDLDTLMRNAREASDFLKALAHEARLMILCLLIDGERSVTSIEQALQLRQPAVSQQLARLRSDGLVEARRNGKHIYYSLARNEAREVIEAMHRAFCSPRRHGAPARRSTGR
jgi:DNA-binding transcriptional ArsR family regulator